MFCFMALRVWMIRMGTDYEALIGGKVRPKANSADLFGILQPDPELIVKRYRKRPSVFTAGEARHVTAETRGNSIL
jgi:hypothetical protein